MLPTVIMKPIKIPLFFLHLQVVYVPQLHFLYSLARRKDLTRRKRIIFSDKEPSRSFIKMFLCLADHLISDAKENSCALTYVYTFHQVSEVEATALWLPIRGKCPEIYRVIVMDVIEYELLCSAPSRWPVGEKDWLDGSNKSTLSTNFYLRINCALFLSVDIFDTKVSSNVEKEECNWEDVFIRLIGKFCLCLLWSLEGKRSIF